MKKTINGIEYSAIEWIHHGFKVGFIVWKGIKQYKINDPNITDINSAIEWVLHRG